MIGNHIKIYHWLTPLSWLYGMGVGVRNFMFDRGLLRSVSYDVPVICVGNLTVGGTGKTPHTEYLINLLSGQCQVAVLSRGYKRKTKGFLLANSDTPMSDIGDEPYQMKRKFPHARVAVDRDRRNGIEQLLKPTIQPKTDVVILDDAFQHRYVHPGLSILLMDSHRLVYLDKLLPAGRLREPISGMIRADIVIVTKCEPNITPDDMQVIRQHLRLEARQQLFFTTFVYGDLYPLYGNQCGNTLPLAELKNRENLLLSGIASPRQLESDLSKIATFSSLHFSDHHDFTASDIAEIERRGKGKTIITTEKDASRLLSLGSKAFSPDIAQSIFVLPITVAFVDGKQEEFNKTITSYVRKD